jgi:DNA-binding response OmpR family regulator
MPNMNGLELTKKIRTINNKIPIIMITAKTDDYSIEKAFKAGVNDYVKKPLSFNELEIRFKRFLSNEEDYKLDHVKNTLLIHNQEIIFTNKEFEIIKILLKNKNQIISKEDFSLKV